MSAIPPSWFQSILGALILALLVAIAIRWVKLPYTIALVIVGLIVGWLGEFWMPEDIELTGLLTAETISSSFYHLYCLKAPVRCIYGN